jgi:hypothetical protein
MMRTKSENLFKDFKFFEMKFVIFKAPHSFDGDKADELIQMYLLQMQRDSPRKENVVTLRCQIFILIYLDIDFQKLFNLHAKYVGYLVAHICMTNYFQTRNERKAKKVCLQ